MFPPTRIFYGERVHIIGLNEIGVFPLFQKSEKYTQKSMRLNVLFIFTFLFPIPPTHSGVEFFIIFFIFIHLLNTAQYNVIQLTNRIQ